MVHEFEQFRLDTRRRLLFCGDDERPLLLTSKAFDTLLYLVEHGQCVVDKRTLMEAIWPSVVVEENNLSQVIMSLRRALGEQRNEHRFIVTVPGRGYRFVAEVHSRCDEVSVPAPATTTRSAEQARWVGTAISIAVLPFANLTGNPEKDYLADGISAELIHKLTRVPGFRVPARTSSFAYKGRNVHVRDIARDLGVSAILEGSIRSAGEQLRVTAQLIDSRTGFHVWSESYDRKFVDIFALQDELASAIVAALQGDITAAALSETISANPTRDLEAYQLYLQGNALYAQPTEENLRQAIVRFDQAAARDPSFARALCAGALARIAAAGNGWEPMTPAATKVEQDATRALSLDPTLADANRVLGLVSACRRRWLDAAEHFRIAMAGPQVDAITVQVHAIAVLASAGHFRRAMADARRAYGLAPAQASVLMVHATLYSFSGQDAEALKYADFAAAHGWPVNLKPQPWIRSLAARRSGRYEEAARWAVEVSRAARLEGVELVVGLVHEAYEHATSRARALQVMRDLFAVREADVVTAISLPMLLVHWSVGLGDIDFAYLVAQRTLDHFDREGSIPVTSFLPHLWMPELRSFRTDPRFTALATRLGLCAYWNRFGPPDGCELREGQLICH